MATAEITLDRTRRVPPSRQSTQTFLLDAAAVCLRILSAEPDKPETACSENETVRLTRITSLPDPTLRLVLPICAVVERLDSDDYMAEAPDADVYASGDTEDEAIRNLEDMIAATFGHFSTVPQERLGPIPRRQLKVLRRHIRIRQR